MQKHPKLSLIEHFKNLPDPRVDRTKDHDLIDVLVIAVCTLLCAGETFNDMEDFGKAKYDWFKTFLNLRSGIPSHDTFNRVFAALDPQEFLDCFLRWTQTLREAIPQEIVALDGKALRRALNQDQSIKYIVSAWAETNGLVLGQLKVADKSNEITAVPQLLRVLELGGCIVTVDAMGCQKNIAKEVVESDADYVLALKGNQETLHQTVIDYIDEQSKNDFAKCKARRHLTEEKGHGREEIRSYVQMPVPEDLKNLELWKGLKSIGMATLVCVRDGKETIETRYYISSLGVRVKQFARAIRSHWGIENGCHWSLDMIYRDDESRIREPNMRENFAWLNRFTLSLLKQHPDKKQSTVMKRRSCGWSENFLLEVLTGAAI